MKLSLSPVGSKRLQLRIAIGLLAIILASIIGCTEDKTPPRISIANNTSNATVEIFEAGRSQNLVLGPKEIIGIYPSTSIHGHSVEYQFKVRTSTATNILSTILYGASEYSWYPVTVLINQNDLNQFSLSKDKER